MSSSGEKLNRFTMLRHVVDMLKHRHLVLTNPAGWSDKTDRGFLEHYRKQKKHPKIFATCFMMADETSHHWEVFAHGPDGCCVEFDREALLAQLGPDLIHGAVDYPPRKTANIAAIPIPTLPFVKGHPYRDEREYRILGAGAKSQKLLKIPIDLNCIRRITLSGRMTAGRFAREQARLAAALGNSLVRINRSTLYKRDFWLAELPCAITPSQGPDPAPINPAH